MTADNPVYRCLTRRNRWPSKHQANWLGVTTALLVITLGLAAQLVADPLALLPRAIFLSAVVLVILAPPVVFAITALATGQDISHDDYGLLLLSKLSDEAIFAGHIQAAYHRLHVLHVVPIAILIGMCPMAAAVLYGNNQPGNLGLSIRISAFSTLICGPTILVPIIAIFVVLYELALRSGVWIGLRWGRLAPSAAGLVLIIWTMLLSPTVCWLAPFFVFIYGPQRDASIFACLLWPGALTLIIAIYWLLDTIQERAYQVLTRRRTGR
ncbi:MAG: hypothetical protein JXB30_11650 [Anaerolineae bacterium]|nr:hypothetical protein [Anaerolineae bacterium]